MKYEILDNGRIKALKDFSDVKKGNVGGYVESEDNLSQDGNCWVYDNARIFDNTRICGNTRIYGNAQIYGYARVHGCTKVYDNATICDNVEATR